MVTGKKFYFSSCGVPERICLSRYRYQSFSCFCFLHDLPFSHYSSFDLVDTLRTEFQMTYVGTLQNNRKGLPADFKSTEGREDGDYMVLYDVTGKKSIHSWINNKKAGGLPVSVFIFVISVPPPTRSPPPPRL